MSNIDINNLMNELSLLMLRIISTEIDNENYELLSEFNIDKETASYISDELSQLSIDHQHQLIRNSSGNLLSISSKDDSFFVLSQNERRNVFRSELHIYQYEANWLVLRLISLAVQHSDDILLEQIGLQKHDAQTLLELNIKEQKKLIRDCTASHGFSICVEFNPNVFTLAKNKLHRDRIRASFIDTLLFHGAPQPLLNKHAGITKQEAAALRKALNAKNMRSKSVKKGGQRKADNEIYRQLEQDWVRDISYCKNLSDELDLNLDTEWELFHEDLLKYYILAKKHNILISSIWAERHTLDLLNT